MPDSNRTQETQAPSYTEAEENGFSARLQTFKDKYPGYPVIPITKPPSAPGPPPKCLCNPCSGRSDAERWDSPAARRDAHDLQSAIVAALFAVISSKDTAGVTHLISQGLISPDCPKADGETPLLACIRAARSAALARALLALGADPDLAGMTEASLGPDDDNTIRGCGDGYVERTPLMLAAATGQLAVVRILVGEFGADDAAVGTRGETALRLAAEAGHRDVVRYLPARRRGAWRRLRCSREVVALRRAVVTAGEMVAFLGWELPRLLLVQLPWKIGRWAWTNRGRIGRWVVRVVRWIPRGLGDVAKGVWRGIEGVPRATWRMIVWISQAVPRAWGVLWKGLVDGTKRVGRAVAFAARRLVSVLHSFFAAVIDRLKNITLRDVGHDLSVAIGALVVKLPGAVWSFMSQLVVVAGRAIDAFFNSCCILLLFKALCLVPKILWEMVESLWASFGRGVDELITLVNPKRVSSGGSRL